MYSVDYLSPFYIAGPYTNYFSTSTYWHIIYNSWQLSNPKFHKIKVIYWNILATMPFPFSLFLTAPYKILHNSISPSLPLTPLRHSSLSLSLSILFSSLPLQLDAWF